MVFLRHGCNKPINHIIFVVAAADAQFTPKTVEIAYERETLMFRVMPEVETRVLKEYSG
jgi:hypothetical protein